MKKIRVLVVDDSAFMRKTIKEMLQSDSEIEVIDTARDGEEAIEKLYELSPDVITLDINMPVMDGQKALEIIMRERPTPVVILSSLTQEEADVTLSLLDMGAFDYVPKPGGTVSLNIKVVQNEVIQKVKKAYIYRNRVGKKALPKRFNFKSSQVKERKLAEYVIAIGISTGGPGTLFDILENVEPPPPDTAYLVSQHMPETFTKSLADRLGNLTPINFRHAMQSEAILGGYGYLAPGNWHMSVTDTKRIKLLKDDNYLYYPSVDVLFSSVAKVFAPKAIGVILTGIGRDGANGLLEMKHRGCHTIAESKETAVVYGMPMEAKEIGAATTVLPSFKIAKEIDRALKLIKRKFKES